MCACMHIVKVVQMENKNSNQNNASHIQQAIMCFHFPCKHSATVNILIWGNKLNITATECYQKLVQQAELILSENGLRK